jgi:hypothetical protein
MTCALLAAVGCRAPEPSAGSGAPTATAAAHEGLLYGRVTTEGGAVHEGPLRFGGDEEALWGNTFNGAKRGNTWASEVPAGRLPRVDLSRPFMARYGDISRIERSGRDLLVTLKSGTLFTLDRFEADDFADGVRVWNGAGGFVDLEERHVRAIELLPVARPGTGPAPLHGTVHTRGRDFTGFIQWNRKECLDSDTLAGLGLPFDTIRSIARSEGDIARVALRDGSWSELPGARADRGIYVDDPRYGRVLVSWDAFESVEFSPGGTGPAYDDFPAGGPLTGSVVTRSGRRLSGRLVYDLDESEITETLDAPSRGVDHSILLGLVASVSLPVQGGAAATVTLHSGEELELDLAGDLDQDNAGVLVFLEDRQAPEYVPWPDVERIELDRPPSMYPPNFQPG